MTSNLQPVRVAEDDLLEFSRAVARHFYESEQGDSVGLFAEVFRQRYRAWWVRTRTATGSSATSGSSRPT
jgi:hypothetical protein